MVGALTHINGNSIVHAPSISNFRGRLLSNRSMVVINMSTSTSQSYWTSVNAEVEANLKRVLLVRPPLSVFEPMHHLALAAPKTTAPALCIAACELVGGNKDQAMAAASALHLMHASLFVHEQLPLTDRRKPIVRPKMNHSFGPNIKLLTGDGMIPFGVELLAQMNDPGQNNLDRVLRVIVEITRAMGSQGVIEGQYNMFQHSQSSGKEAYHASIIDKVCKKKEGELHGCAGACGAILGGGSEEEVEKLRRYGQYVGMIQGISNLVGRDEKWRVIMKEVTELRDLALKELEGFNQGKVEAISSLAETKISNV